MADPSPKGRSGDSSSTALIRVPGTLMGTLMLIRVPPAHRPTRRDHLRIRVPIRVPGTSRVGASHARATMYATRISPARQNPIFCCQRLRRWSKSAWRQRLRKSASPASRRASSSAMASLNHSV